MCKFQASISHDKILVIEKALIDDFVCMENIHVKWASLELQFFPYVNIEIRSFSIRPRAWSSRIMLHIQTNTKSIKKE